MKKTKKQKLKNSIEEKKENIDFFHIDEEVYVNSFNSDDNSIKINFKYEGRNIELSINSIGENQYNILMINLESNNNVIINNNFMLDNPDNIFNKLNESNFKTHIKYIFRCIDEINYHNRKAKLANISLYNALNCARI